MGLLKAGAGALGSALGDQWLEYFYCDALSLDVLVTKGEKKTSRRSSNTRGSDNVINNGSIIAVADGQCMLIVEQGKVVDFCAEPGEYTYEQGTEPSLFYGNLGQNIVDTFKIMGKRFAFGGETPKTQCVYYVNTKEILDNKFGTPVPIPFRVYDANIGLDIDTAVRCNGIYSYKIQNPILFYTNVTGNVESEYRRETIDETMKAELLTHFGPALAQISAEGIRPNALVGKNLEITNALRNELTAEWMERRGILMVNVALNSVSIPPEDDEIIKQAQRTAMMRDPNMAAASIVTAQSDAMRTAAGNKNGAMMGFMGMGMATQAGGYNPAQLFQMGQQNQTAKSAPMSQQPQNNAQSAGVVAAGTVAAGNWTCECGAVNQGKFCSNCGKQRPAEAPVYRCSKCGYVIPDSKTPPKFCPECGAAFTATDSVK